MPKHAAGTGGVTARSTAHGSPPTPSCPAWPCCSTLNGPATGSPRLSGNPMLGAPNLTDDAWLYGSSEDAVYTSLVQGRNGVMPSHGNLLGENRTKILAAYVYSLSQ